MKTRVFGILLALVLLVTGTAMATEVETKSMPSKTAADTTTVEEIKKDDGTALPENFQLTTNQENEIVNATVAAIKAYVEEEKKAVSTFLPQTCQEEIQKKLDEIQQNVGEADLGVEKKAEDLVVYDCVPLNTVNYDEAYGDLSATFTFATPYQEEQTVFAVVGIPVVDENGEIVMEWIVLPAQVVAEGKVEVQFDQATLSKLGQEGAMMMLMTEEMTDPLAK